MNPSNAVIAGYEDLRSLAFGGISGVYAAVGTPFENPVRMLKVTNLTDADLLISFNGVTDKDVIAAGSAFIYDYASNKAEPGGGLEQPAFQRLYVKQATAAPTLKSVYVTVIYASGV
jgi:hypothetical protein